MQRLNSGVVAAVLIALSACAVEPSTHADDTAQVSHIKSAAQLEAFLKATPQSPLDSLTPDARRRFIDSLVFTQYGLGSYSHAELQGLSGSEVYQILHLFDAEHTTTMVTKAPVLDVDGNAIGLPKPSPFDQYSYKCETGDCVSAINYICLSTCSRP